MKMFTEANGDNEERIVTGPDQCIPKLSVAAGILPAAEGVHLAARSNA